MPEQSLSNTHIFSVRHTTALLCLEALDRASALCWGHLKQQNHQRKAQKCEKLLQYES